MKKPFILFIGDHRWHEFHNLKLWSEKRASLIVTTDPDQACQVIATSKRTPDLIVFLTIRPDQYTLDDFHKVGQLSPFSKTISLLGTWCEGGQRTSRALPGVLRMYWHRWRAYLSFELSRTQNHLPASWSLPDSTSEDDWLSLGLSPASKKAWLEVDRKLLLICSKDFETGSALSDAFRATNFSTVWSNSFELQSLCQPNAILFDDWALNDQTYSQLATLKSRFPQTPILALVNFVRHAENAKLLATGATTIVSKPFQIEHLRNLLNEMTSVKARHVENSRPQNNAA